MKNSMLMIPLIALGTMGLSAKVNATPGLVSVAHHRLQMQDDPLMTGMDKMTKEMQTQQMKGNTD
jgi:hypothetical protein